MTDQPAEPLPPDIEQALDDYLVRILLDDLALDNATREDPLTVTPPRSIVGVDSKRAPGKGPRPKKGRTA